MSFLFGAKADPIPSVTPRFTSGGLNFEGLSGVSPTAERTGVVNNVAGSYGGLADTLGGLRSSVAPGFNDLLSSRLTQINDSARSAVGDLRTNLASRRILGSSFGNDTITRANSEFSRQRDAAISDNFLKSLDASQKLATQEYTARTSQFQTALDELNLEAGLGNQVAGAAAKIFNDNAKAQAELDAKAQAGAGNFLGTLVGKALPILAAPFTGGASLAALPFTSGLGNSFMGGGSPSGYGA